MEVMSLENRKIILEIMYLIYVVDELRVWLVNGYEVSVDIDLDYNFIRVIIEVII